jgi:ubiquinone/menaquinone biosynthesis C-methylase UbiE
MWNHNIHYHDYLLHQIPHNVDRSLDVGCGLGTFAMKLALISTTVDAIDVNSAALTEALNQHDAENINYQGADFLEADLPKNAYDVVVAIASVHHMDLAEVLQKMKLLLRPSGKLLILGLYREKNILDYIYSVISIPLNLIYLHWHRTDADHYIDIAPTRPASLSLNQIGAVAKTILPGAKIHRHLFWRYSLIWKKHKK